MKNEKKKMIKTSLAATQGCGEAQTNGGGTCGEGTGTTPKSDGYSTMIGVPK